MGFRLANVEGRAVLIDGEHSFGAGEWFTGRRRVSNHVAPDHQPKEAIA
jgi:hypothetical protein